MATLSVRLDDKTHNAFLKFCDTVGLGIEEQKRRLEKDGIKVEDYRVTLKLYQWIT